MNTTIARLDSLEGRFERLVVDVKQLGKQINALNSQIVLVQGQTSGGSSGTGSIYVAVTGSGGIPAASGAPGTGSPGSASGLSVYLVSGGAHSLVSGSATVYNPYLSATASAVKVITVGPNGDGTFTLLGESCT